MKSYQLARGVAAAGAMRENNQRPVLWKPCRPVAGRAKKIGRISILKARSWRAASSGVSPAPVRRGRYFWR